MHSPDAFADVGDLRLPTVSVSTPVDDDTGIAGVDLFLSGEVDPDVTDPAGRRRADCRWVERGQGVSVSTILTHVRSLDRNRHSVPMRPQPQTPGNDPGKNAGQ